MHTQRIVHISSSLQRGGAEQLLLQLIKALQPSYEQSVIYLHDGPYRAELIALGIPHYQLTAPGGYANPLLWIRMFRLLRQQQPSIVHTSLWAASIMGRVCCRLLRIPVVASLHTLAPHEGWLRTTFDRLTGSKEADAIATSQTIARSMIRAQRYSPARMTIIPSGIDIRRLQEQALQPPDIPYIKEPGTFLIGSVGRLVPVKQYDLLLKAFAELQHQFPELRLLLIGTGPEEAALRALVQKLHVDSFVTIITNQIATPYYQLFDCFVLPSRYEGLGLATLEACYFSIPVIVTEQLGGHEIVHHRENGLLIPAATPAAISNAIRRYIEDSQLRMRCAQAGHATVMEGYTAPRMLAAYRRLFEQLISTHRQHSN